MYVKTIEVSNKDGLKARPASFLVQISKRVKGGLWVEKNDHRANAKELPELLALNIKLGDTIRIIAEKEDEATVEEMIEIFN